MYFLSLQFLYENENYDKPFFCTYFKTSMFTLYLLVLGLIAPWKEACAKNGNYTLVDPSTEDDLFYSNENSNLVSNFVSYVYYLSTPLPKCRQFELMYCIL